MCRAGSAHGNTRTRMRLLVLERPWRRDRLIAGSRRSARFLSTVGIVTQLFRNDANLLECFAKRLRHLRENALSMGGARIPRQVVQVRRAELRVTQPIIDHVWRYPREALLAAQILLSHARSSQGGSDGSAHDNQGVGSHVSCSRGGCRPVLDAANPCSSELALSAPS